MLCHAGMSSQATEGRAELCCEQCGLPCSTHRRHTSLIWRSRCLLLIRWDHKLTLLHSLGAQHLRPVLPQLTLKSLVAQAPACRCLSVRHRWVWKCQHRAACLRQKLAALFVIATPVLPCLQAPCGCADVIPAVCRPQQTMSMCT